MSPEEQTYLLVLLVSLPAGFVLKNAPSPLAKRLGAAGLGVAITLVLCGAHILHSLLTTALTCLIVRMTPRHCHTITLVWTFTYLMFFRTCHHFGFPGPPPYANAIQLLLTLKLVSLANEINDFHFGTKKEDSKDGKISTRDLVSVPSLVETFCYAYCYIGFMTGPFYRFRTYHDWVQEQQAAQVPSWKPMLLRLKHVPMLGAFFLLASAFFNLDEARQDDFYERGLPYRLFFMVPMFFIFRMRFYVAWILAECTCMAAGFGAYPREAKARSGGGPTMQWALKSSDEQESRTVEYDYESIKNIDYYSTDFCVRVKDGMRYWNMTVQWWLAQYIYKKAPFKSYILRSAVTMLISAFWHGIHPGYYLSFLTIPLCLAAETVMERAVRNRLPPSRTPLFDWVHWFLKMRAFDYMCMGFILLSYEETVRYWRSVYFVMHVVTLGFALLGHALCLLPKTVRRVAVATTE